MRSGKACGSSCIIFRLTCAITHVIFPYMQRLGALALRFSPVLVLTTAFCLPAQKSGAGTGTSGGAGTGTRPPLPTPAPSYGNYPINSGNDPLGLRNPTYNFPTSSGPQVDPMLARLLRQERQKQVVRDTDRLVRLTSQYQAEVKASGTTATTEKHLKEIEKLAHNVRTTLTQ